MGPSGTQAQRYLRDPPGGHGAGEAPEVGRQNRDCPGSQGPVWLTAGSWALESRPRVGRMTSDDVTDPAGSGEGGLGAGTTHPCPGPQAQAACRALSGPGREAWG